MHRTSRRRLGWLALAAALLVLAVSASSALAGSVRHGSAAPLDPAFLRSLVTPPIAALSSAAGGHGLGAISGPQDFSYTRGMQVPGVSGTVARGTLPATYDLRTLGRVTPAKDQGAFGACWTFASLGSLESCLLPGATWDFSEDNMVLTSGFTNGGDPYNHGGFMEEPTAYLVRWGGPVNESEDAYGDSYTPPGLTPRKHVQDVIWIPTRGGALDNDNIKNAVMQYGGADADFAWHDSAYNESTASYYYSSGPEINHAVLIVGWDDNYSAANFATRPPGDGAFIVKNSWGASFGRNGYFYVSYYDVNLGRVHLAAVFDNAESTSNYTGIYQYDPLGDCNNYGYGNSTGWFANVFTANSTGSLGAVGFYALAPGTSYEVYTGSSLGTKTLRTSGTLASMGYHTVTLPSAVGITSGQSFVVAVKVTSSGTGYPIAYECPIAGYSSGATAQAGQSYVSSGGSSWMDLTTQYANANVCLKAYTTGSGPTPGDDDDVPGVTIPASPVTGSVSHSSDTDDVFGIALNSGQTLHASITGPPATDLRLYLYSPGTASVKDPNTPYEAVAYGTTYPCSFTYTATQSGTHYLDVYAYSGAGGYTVTYSVTSPDEDTVGPVCAARNLTVKRGATCKIYFKVHDALSAQVTTHVALTTNSGVVKKSWSWGYDTNSASWWYVSYKCTLAKGSYRIVVTGKDLAGNAQSKVGRATLTVK